MKIGEQIRDKVSGLVGRVLDVHKGYMYLIFGGDVYVKVRIGHPDYEAVR